MTNVVTYIIPYFFFASSYWAVCAVDSLLMCGKER
jgi:hypothetical protein